jgi:ribose 5-phosphate isomerase A
VEVCLSGAKAIGHSREKPAGLRPSADGTCALQEREALKREAARRALDYVRPGMKLGLGTGTTARHFTDLLGERVRAGLSVVGVPTSAATEAQARALGVPLATLEDCPELDLTVDGADEIDAELRLIKGGGGALLREKIVAAASRRLLVIADTSKFVERLGAFPLAVEVAPFGLAATRRHIEALAGRFDCRGPISLRRAAGGGPFVTDGGHHLIDCAFGAIAAPAALGAALHEIPGVVEHGLFLGLAAAAILAGPDGVRVLGEIG